MIIIDENNKEFASEIQTVLRGRGVDSTVFCDSVTEPGVRSDKVFVSSSSINTDLKSDPEQKLTFLAKPNELLQLSRCLFQQLILIIRLPELAEVLLPPLI